MMLLMPLSTAGPNSDRSIERAVVDAPMRPYGGQSDRRTGPGRQNQRSPAVPAARRAADLPDVAQRAEVRRVEGIKASALCRPDVALHVQTRDGGVHFGRVGTVAVEFVQQHRFFVLLLLLLLLPPSGDRMYS